MKRFILAAAVALATIPGPKTAAQPAPTPAVTNPSTAEFVIQAARIAMLDLAATSEVRDRIRDPAFKAYAGEVIDDDLKMQGTLQTVAQKAGVTPPSDLDPERALVLRDLQGSDGAQLAQKYRAEQIDATRQAIQLFHDFRQNQRDPGLRQWLDAALPTLEKRLEAASRLPQVPSAPQG